MKPTIWYALAIVPLLLLASTGAIGTQLVVLGISLGIFFGTLSLGRPAASDATTTNPGH